MKFRCAHCKKLIGAPLKRRVVKCGQCSSHVLVNPERPFVNVFFLFFLVMPFITAYFALTSPSWKATDILASAVLLLIPLSIYLLLMFLSGTTVVDISKVPASLLAEADGRPTHGQQAMAPTPVSAAGATPKWFLLTFLAGFVAWGYVYLFMLRPVMNAWLVHYISSYPAMLHLIPILGVPIAVGILAGKMLGFEAKKQ